jgi:hypothetical protein
MHPHSNNPGFRYWKAPQIGLSRYLQQILLQIIQIPGHYFVPHLRCSYPFHKGIPTLRSGLCTAASSRLFSLPASPHYAGQVRNLASTAGLSAGFAALRRTSRFQLRLTSCPNNYEARRADSDIAPAVRPGFGARKQMSTEGAAHIRIQSNIGIRDKVFTFWRSLRPTRSAIILKSRKRVREPDQARQENR